jgi:hypothetical protein
MVLKIKDVVIKKIYKSKFFRLLFIVIILGLSLSYLLKQENILPVNDFIGYWSASRLLITQGNPYSPTQLTALQIEGGLTFQQPHLLYNPPWTLPIIVIFGIFTRSEGQILWLLFQIGVLLFSSTHIWRLFGGKIKHQWISWVVTFTFGAVIAAVLFQGQISPLILMGLVGFLAYVEKPGKEWLSGAFAVLITVKPQVVYLFIIAFLFWGFFNKKWAVIISFFSGLALLSGIAILFDQNIFHQYLQCILTDAPAGWATPTIGTYLRLYFNPTEFLLSFITPILGAIWLVYYWIRKKKTWDWKKEIPLILFISVITTIYIWTYDMVVLLIPIIMALIWQLYENKKWISILVSIAYFIINLIYLRLHLILEDSIFIWFAPVLFVWYLVAYRLHIRHENINTIPESA